VDDPLLTAREVYRARPLTRVVFDWRLRAPSSARVFSTLDAGPVVVFVLGEMAQARASGIAALRDRGVTIERLPTRDLGAAVSRLGARQLLSLLVEGGPTLQQALAGAGMVDAVQRVTTPHAIGGGVAAPPIVRDTPEGAVRTRLLGEDALVEFDVHRTH
jgi:diaminohydroxyphosphoribosylaminopyrimidine deaminase/5-amino-6-(5-phosphoribosylamino)uracil reductase